MVSSVFNISPEELIERLKEVAARNAGDPEYEQLRAALPDDFPF